MWIIIEYAVTVYNSAVLIQKQHANIKTRNLSYLLVSYLLTGLNMSNAFHHLLCKIWKTKTFEVSYIL